MHTLELERLDRQIDIIREIKGRDIMLNDFMPVSERLLSMPLSARCYVFAAYNEYVRDRGQVFGDRESFKRQMKLQIHDLERLSQKNIALIEVFGGERRIAAQGCEEGVWRAVLDEEERDVLRYGLHEETLDAEDIEQLIRRLGRRWAETILGRGVPLVEIGRFDIAGEGIIRRLFDSLVEHYVEGRLDAQRFVNCLKDKLKELQEQGAPDVRAYDWFKGDSTVAERVFNGLALRRRQVDGQGSAEDLLDDALGKLWNDLPFRENLAYIYAFSGQGLLSRRFKACLEYLKEDAEVGRVNLFKFLFEKGISDNVLLGLDWSLDWSGQDPFVLLRYAQNYRDRVLSEEVELSLVRSVDTVENAVRVLKYIQHLDWQSKLDKGKIYRAILVNAGERVGQPFVPRKLVLASFKWDTIKLSLRGSGHFQSLYLLILLRAEVVLDADAEVVLDADDADDYALMLQSGDASLCETICARDDIDWAVVTTAVIRQCSHQRGSLALPVLQMGDKFQPTADQVVSLLGQNVLSVFQLEDASIRGHKEKSLVWHEVKNMAVCHGNASCVEALTRQEGIDVTDADWQDVYFSARDREQVDIAAKHCKPIGFFDFLRNSEPKSDYVKRYAKAVVQRVVWFALVSVLLLTEFLAELTDLVELLNVNLFVFEAGVGLLILGCLYLYWREHQNVVLCKADRVAQGVPGRVESLSSAPALVGPEVPQGPCAAAAAVVSDRSFQGV